MMSHTPYSPDLAPNDFFLFPHVQNKMRGQRFSTSEEAVDLFIGPFLSAQIVFSRTMGKHICFMVTIDKYFITVFTLKPFLFERK